MQEAADEAGGFEGPRIQHNCKEGALYRGGVSAETITAVFLMETAAHGWLWFDETKKLIKSVIKRFAEEKPDRNEWDPTRKPNTSCLCFLKDTNAFATYAGSSWAARNAFISQLLKPYARVRKGGIFPVVRLGFKEGQKDEYGNHLPEFAITGWEPRSRFACVLGEEETTAPTLAPINAPAAIDTGAPAKKPIVVTSGRQWAPVEDDGYAGVDPNDEIPF